MSNTNVQIPNLDEIVKQITFTVVKLFQDNPSLLKKTADVNVLITHSFKMVPESLETLKDIVHTKRMAGHTEYTQTRALYDAIEILASTMKINPRPEEVKQKEKDRSNAISEARNKAKLATAA